jgi:AraC-like DNA-binding protein
MHGVQQFSTDSVTPRDRLAVWGESVWSKLGGVETSLFEKQPFHASLRAGQLGSVHVCKIEVGAHKIRRTRQLVRQCDPSLLKLVFQVRGHAYLEQLDERIVLKPGDWCVYDGSLPYTLFNREAVEQLALLVPRNELAGPGFVGSRELLKPAPSSGLSRILYNCLQSTVNELDSLPAPQRFQLGESLAEFARLALRERAAGGPRISNRQLACERIKHFIRQNAGDSALSVDSIASAFHCTKRYLHKLFADDDCTLSRFIWETRLERCGADLANRELATRSITEIAFAWGFVNSAHFSRVFRDRYGVTPRDYRSGQKVESKQISPCTAT